MRLTNVLVAGSVPCLNVPGLVSYLDVASQDQPAQIQLMMRLMVRLTSEANPENR